MTVGAPSRSTPYTLGVLHSHVTMLDAERAVAGEHYQDHGLLFCWEDGPTAAPGHDHYPLQSTG